MSEWSVEPLEKMPPPYVSGGARPGGLSLALRTLPAGRAIFVPAREGEELPRLFRRLQSLIQYSGIKGLNKRRDAERGGYWIYRNGTGGSS